MPSIEIMRELLSDRLAHGNREPVSNQIADAIWLAVVRGVLSTGERLPTSREVAIDLGINPRSVERGYRELEERGVVAVTPEGVFISLRPPPEEELQRHQRFAKLCRETYDSTQELGFSLDDLLEALAEYRSIERGQPE